MTEFSPDIAFEALARVLKENSPNADLDRIRGAFDFAVKAHDGQMRRDGTPYVTHTIAAATIAAEMGLDDESVMASCSRCSRSRAASSSSRTAGSVKRSNCSKPGSASGLSSGSTWVAVTLTRRISSSVDTI